MEVKIINLADDFIKYWEEARDKGLEEKKVLWKKKYADKHKYIFDYLIELFKMWDEDFSFEYELEQSFSLYERRWSNINNLRDIDKYIFEICDKCEAEFRVEDIKLNFIIMAGLNMANAIATEFNEGTSFYFLEKMPRTKYAPILFAHEITHLFHQYKGKDNFINPTIAYKLVSEGLAVFSSEKLCPGFNFLQYLVQDDGGESWLAECKKVSKNIKLDLINDLNKSESKYDKKYFQGDNSIKDGIPTRIGYFIGYNVIKDLNKIYTLSDIMAWDSERIEKEVRVSIERII